MENRINITELLKDCPRGMKLYSPIFGEVYLDKIRPHLAIVVTTDKEQGDFKEEFLYDGRYGMNGECMLFPSKGKTTWEGFHRPFKDGDVVIGNNACCSYIAIYKEFRDKSSFYCHAVYNSFGKFRTNDYSDKSNLRLATEEEKQKLFDAIKANGYKWNAETKTLEKLPKFKVGDRVKHISAYTSGIIVKVDDKGYHIDYPKGEGVCYISFTLEKDYELAPNKFDITTLKPFDKVLVRDGDTYVWEAHLFSRYYKNSDKPYICIGVEGLNEYRQCIPYDSNKELLGTTNDCDNYYKSWK